MILGENVLEFYVYGNSWAVCIMDRSEQKCTETIASEQKA